MTVIVKITTKEATSFRTLLPTHPHFGHWQHQPSSQFLWQFATLHWTEASIFPKATEICSQFIQVPR